MHVRSGERRSVSGADASIEANRFCLTVRFSSPNTLRGRSLLRQHVRPIRSRCLMSVLAVATLLGALAPLPDAPAAGASPRTIVSLTFNDGFVSQFGTARDILLSHRMRGTFYVSFGFIGKPHAGTMTMRQLRQLYRDGNEIGGMGLDARNLTDVFNNDWTQDYQAKRQQVCADRRSLAMQGFDPQTFAYPQGAYAYEYPDGGSVEGIVKSCGYLAARAIGGLTSAGPAFSESVPPADPFALGTPGRPSPTHLRLAELERAVISAASNGGGWVPLVFNRVCHRGATKASQPWFRACMSTPRAVSAAVFSSFLDWLKNSGRSGGAPVGTRVETVRQVVGSPPQTPLPPARTTVSLSFDDGYRSQFSLGFEHALLPHHTRATFFVSSGGVSAHRATMTWPQLLTLRSGGNEIGGETVHHFSLRRRAPLAKKVREVCQDRSTLTQHGLDATTFAYPEGIYNRGAEKIVRDCGYQAARAAGGVSPTGRITAETLPPRDPFAIRTIRGPDSPILLSNLERAVRAAASHGGGLVTFIFYRVCSKVYAPTTFRSCMSSYRPVLLSTLNSLLTWLHRAAPPRTSVATIRQAVSSASL
jgi:peptidoglycan/xylan/chitin deacetylase (PgdA/CDA1 family)